MIDVEERSYILQHLDDLGQRAFVDVSDWGV
jgi:hypothetical protein